MAHVRGLFWNLCRSAIRSGLAGALVVMVVPASVSARPAPERLSLPLSLVWKYTATYDTNNPASPAVEGDSVYFACGDRVYCLDTASGALKWRFPQDQPLPTRIRSTPAISGDMLYFGAEDGKLYALNTETGKGTWLFDTRTSVGSSPTISEGVVYFGAADGRVFAIDTRTGAEVPTWKGGFKAQDEISGAPVVANGIVYVLSLDQVLHAIGAATGKERFSARLGGTVLRMSPVAFGDHVYVAAGSTVQCFMGRNLTPRWKQILTVDVATTPCVTDDGVFVLTADNQVLAFDLRTGRPKWKSPPKLHYDVLAAPVEADGLLFVGTVQGGIYAIDVANGAMKWIYQTQPSTSSEEGIARWTNIAATPVVAGGRLLVLSDDGSLAAFESGGADTTPPMITGLEPAQGVVINGVPPIHFEAKVVDEGSGVNPASVRLLLDGEGIARRREGREFEDDPGYAYDLLTSIVSYNTPEPKTAALIKPLADGRHTVTVVATDWAGNTATKTWSFTVDNSVARLPRRNPNNTNTPGGINNPGGRGGRGGRGGGPNSGTDG